MHELVGTVFHRWYVTLFGLTFVWQAVKHMGWRRTLLYSVSAITIGALAENGSVHFGFPYTRYVFEHSLRGHEIFIGDVPLMVPLSYTFMGYFAFTSGRLLASGPRHTRAQRPWMELALALMLGVWALWVVDPVSRLGDKFYLGRLFHYAGPGFWFGLPLGSQLGFALTATVLVGMLHLLNRHDPDVPVAKITHHPYLVSLITYHGQVFHMAVVAFVVGADAIGGSAILIWVPAALITAVFWSTIGRTGPASAGQDDRQARQAVHEDRGQPLRIPG